MHHAGPSRIAFAELFFGVMPSAVFNVITRNSPMKSIIIFGVRRLSKTLFITSHSVFVMRYPQGWLCLNLILKIVVLLLGNWFIYFLEGALKAKGS